MPIPQPSTTAPRPSSPDVPRLKVSVDEQRAANRHDLVMRTRAYLLALGLSIGEVDASSSMILT